MESEQERYCNKFTAEVIKAQKEIDKYNKIKS